MSRFSRLILAGVLFVSVPVHATTPLTVEPDSTLWLEGDSTLHPFTSRTSQLVLKAELDGTTKEVQPDSLLKGALKQMQLTIPVKGLKSKESALDKNMYKALKAEAFPEIRFDLDKYVVVPSTSSPGVSLITAWGMLHIAGIEQPIALHLDAEPVNGTLRVRGETTLLMTDYGIKPPTMMMGAIKVKNQVVIHFDLHLR